jgi:xanthine dehydrogenase accessory factor
MSIFNKIEELLAKGVSFALAAIVSRSGPAPRDVGTRMVVRADASIVGTIGGGVLEAQVRDLAIGVLSSGKSTLKQFSFTAEEAAGKGMICGGEVKVLVHLVNASHSLNAILYKEIVTALRSRERAWLITRIPEGDRANEPEQCLVKNDGGHFGQLNSRVSQALMPWPERAGLVSKEGNLFFVEPLCRESTVFIFGAGHISQGLAPLTRLVGFRTVVLDDRKEFANRERFETADEVIVPDSFERAMEALEIDEESYLVLVTRGHVHDKTLLRQALRTKAGYIGMIGSRRKRDEIYDALQREGFSRSDFDRVCSPIGIDIRAETPEEIAVSIVAQLIKVRAEKDR